MKLYDIEISQKSKNISYTRYNIILDDTIHFTHKRNYSKTGFLTLLVAMSDTERCV